MIVDVTICGNEEESIKLKSSLPGRIILKENFNNGVVMFDLTTANETIGYHPFFSIKSTTTKCGIGSFRL